MGMRPQPADTPSDAGANLDRVDRSLLDRLEQDGRLHSGISPNQRVDEIDFIQMSGLTQPVPQSAGAGIEDPLDFSEPGVADVDDTASHDAMRHVAAPDPNIVDRVENPSPVAALKDIIAELSADKPDTAPPSSGQAESVVDESVLRMLETIQAERNKQKAPAAESAEAFSPANEAGKAPKPVIRPADMTVVEAQALVDSLEQQPRSQDSAEHDATPVGPIAYRLELETDATPDSGKPGEFGAPPVIGGEPDENPHDAIYEKEDVHPGRRRHHNPKRRFRRRVFAWGLRFVLVIALALFAYQGYVYWHAQLQSPEAILAEAGRAFDMGEYERATMLADQFVAKAPQHPQLAHAQFLAAAALQLSAPESGGGSHDTLVQARSRLERFIAEHPNHEKTARARNLIGVISFDLGEYTACVEVLRDPGLKVLDPLSALPAMRALARSYVKLSDEAAARSAYLQAASMTGNYTPDEDYEELGDFYKSLADRSEDADLRARYQASAVEHWNTAVRIRGVEPARRTQLMFKLDQVRNEIEGVYSSPASSPSAPAVPPASASDVSPDSNPSDTNDPATKVDADDTAAATPEHTAGPDSPAMNEHMFPDEEPELPYGQAADPAIDAPHDIQAEGSQR